MMKKKHTLATFGTLVLGMVLGFGVYVNAQTGGAISAQLFGKDALKADPGDFKYKDDLKINPESKDLKSGPITGKITGDRLTAQEFNRLLELAAEGGSQLKGITCEPGSVMIGILENGDASCLAVSKGSDNEVLFGGMYGQGTSNYPNPLTGEQSCPENYKTAKVFGHPNLDYPIHLCYGIIGEVDPVAYFGGAYGYRPSGNHPNLLTGSDSCPAGYQSAQVLGTYNVDYPAHYCYTTDLDPSNKLVKFQGAYSNSPYNFYNPVTGGMGCPLGSTTNQVLATYSVDWGFFTCYDEDLSGGGGTVIGGGGTGGGSSFHMCNHNGTAVAGKGSNEACLAAQTDRGKGTDRYRVINCRAAGFVDIEIAAHVWYNGTRWRAQAGSAPTRVDCDEATIVVADLQGSGGGIGTGTAGTVDLITPNYTTGYTSYTGSVDASGYDFIEFGGFDGGSNHSWAHASRGTASTITTVLANGKAAINLSSDGQDANITLSFDADSQMTFAFANNSGGRAKLAFVRGINIGAGSGGGAAGGTGAWFTWSRSEGILKSSGIEQIDLVSNRPRVTLSTPMSSDKYAVICNGTRSQGTEEQIFSYNKTPNNFIVQGSHAAKEDPINLLDCIITENGFGGGTGTGGSASLPTCSEGQTLIYDQAFSDWKCGSGGGGASGGNMYFLDSPIAITMVNNNTYAPFSFASLPNTATNVVIEVVQPRVGSGNGTFTQVYAKKTATSPIEYTVLNHYSNDGNSNSGVATQMKVPVSIESGRPTIYLKHNRDFWYNNAPTLRIIAYEVPGGVEGGSAPASLPSCSEGQTLVYDQTLLEWQCGNVSGGNCRWYDFDEYVRDGSNNPILATGVPAGTNVAKCKKTSELDAHGATGICRYKATNGKWVTGQIEIGAYRCDDEECYLGCNTNNTSTSCQIPQSRGGSSSGWGFETTKGMKAQYYACK